MKSFKIPSKKGINVIWKGTTDNPLINLETYFDFILLILIILVISTQKIPHRKLYFNLRKHQWGGKEISIWQAISIINFTILSFRIWWKKKGRKIEIEF